MKCKMLEKKRNIMQNVDALYEEIKQTNHRMVTMQKKNNKLTQRPFWPNIFQNVHKHSGEKSSAKMRLTNNINFYYYSSAGK